MKQKKILFILGTRPEAIKMAPLLQRFLKEKTFITKLCITAQHREMLDQVLDFFELSPDYDLNLMKPNQDLSTLTAQILTQLTPVFQDFKPDYVFVHGDTTTTMATALSAFYHKVKVCHVEAGLRTYNKSSPYPEEINRQVTTKLTDYHFSPTQKAKENLEKEGIAPAQILVTGNTVIDALLQSVEKAKQQNSAIKQTLEKEIGRKELILVTGHRRENHGQGIRNICNAIKKLAYTYPNIAFLYPVHLNPKVQHPVKEILEEISNVYLIPPLNYQDFIWAMQRAKLIITDSGGVQEEAPSLGKPVLVTRTVSERMEAVEAGTVLLVGNDENEIFSKTQQLLENEDFYLKMAQLSNPYGDGKASQRILDFMKKIHH